MANLTQFTDPVAVKKDSAAGIGNTGDDFRFALGGLSQSSPGSTFGYASGVFPSAGSGTTIYDLGLSAATGMTTSLGFGNYADGRSAHGVYLGAATGATTITHPASNATNPRYDYVVIRVRDGDVDSTVTRSADAVVLSGTPAAAPIEPTNLLTDGDFVVGCVLIRTNTTSIIASDIADRRQYVVASGGIYPKSATDSRTGSYVGQYRDNLSTSSLERWSGSSWVPVASPGVYSQYTPVLYAVGSATNVSLGTGSVSICRYNQVGKRLDFNYYWAFGTSPYNGGYGQIVSYLPPGIVGAPYNQWFVCHLWVNLRDGVGAGSVYDFQGQAFVGAGTNVVRPFFPLDNNQQIMAPYQIAKSAGTANGGVPNIANNYPQGGQLTITGSIETA